jgi:hypothetical protein
LVPQRFPNIDDVAKHGNVDVTIPFDHGRVGGFKRSLIGLPEDYTYKSCFGALMDSDNF